MRKSNEQCGTGVALITSGEGTDSQFVSMFLKATGAVVAVIHRPDQLDQLGRPAIVASNGLLEAQTGIYEDGIERTEYPHCDAKKIAKDKGAVYVDLSPGLFRTFVAMIAENIADVSGKESRGIPLYCRPKVAERRIANAIYRR